MWATGTRAAWRVGAIAAGGSFAAWASADGGWGAACDAHLGARSTSQHGLALQHVAGVSIAQYNANGAIEDRFFVHGDEDVAVIGVLDGHGGWQAAEFVSGALPDALLSQHSLVGAGSADRVRKAFDSVDGDYKRQVRRAYDLGFGGVARAGCCALTALVSASEVLVANAGDCRAVLVSAAPATGGDGSQDSEGGNQQEQEQEQEQEVEAVPKAGEPDPFQWVTQQALFPPPPSAAAAASGAGAGAAYTATALSRDHSANAVEEQHALAEQHPGEQDIVLCRHPKACYVKGKLMPTRAFGDFYLKDAHFNNPNPQDRLRGRHVKSPYTPPYITAHPEVRIRQRSASDRAIVLASDGLWDELSNREVAAIVAEADRTPAGRKAAATTLARTALAKAASQAGLTTEELAQVPGSRRRRLHDDITVVVAWLQR